MYWFRILIRSLLSRKISLPDRLGHFKGLIEGFSYICEHGEATETDKITTCRVPAEDSAQKDLYHFKCPYFDYNSDDNVLRNE